MYAVCPDNDDDDRAIVYRVARVIVLSCRYRMVFFLSYRIDDVTCARRKGTQRTPDSSPQQQ